MNRPDLAPRAAGLTLATVLLAGLTTSPARSELVAVSPGELDRAVEATSACPTFSWSALPGATAYELVALRLDRSAEPEVVWTRTVAGSATSWSPSRGDCLEAGGSYAWTFRALGPDSPAPDSPEAEWAEALRFLVPGAPSDDEVAAALATLERWREGRSEIAGGDSAAGATLGPAPAARRSPSRASGAAPDANLATGVAAIRGENPDNSGSSFGLFGISHSPDGAGVVARNDSAGADLILDGEANGAGDTLLRQDSLDRPSANPESFDFRNSGAGALTLKVDGVDVVTTASDKDTLGALSCPDGQVAKRVSGAWQCANDADSDTTYLAGNQLQLTGSTFDVLEGAASGLDADTVDGLDSTALATAAHGHFGASWTGNGTALTLENLATTGNFSGLVSRTYTETGAAVYGLHGHLSASGFGVYGRSDSSEGIGVRGSASRWGVSGLAFGGSGAAVFGGALNATGDLRGVWGYSAQSPDGVGVVGEAQAPSGATHGAWGVAFSTSGTGVRGQTTATTGATRGVFGETASTGGIGVFGQASATSGATRGVYGETASAASGIGVLGKATSLTGLNFGVVGEGPSADSIGVHGLVTSTLGNPWGVYGETRSTSTNGVNPRATGVYGLATGTSGDALGVAGGSASLLGAGVYGFNSGGGFAGYFQGKVHVNGTLSKAGGSFRIDHPLDPENRYLSHSFVESPDMMNLYNGNATLDANGEAWVELPDWFEALNRDFRYQLTPLGSWSALWIEREVEGNRFLIRGGPHSRVSWQVSGIRHDAWAEAHRIPIEEEKPESERGLYLHPEAWSQPAEKGLYRLDANGATRTEGVPLESPVPAAPTALAHVPPPLPERPWVQDEGHGQR